MERIPIWASFLSVILLLQTANSADEEALLKFFQQLSTGNHSNKPLTGWNDSSDPCISHWDGIDCENGPLVKKINLEGLGLDGVFDADSICGVQSLLVLNIQNNGIHGEISGGISNCKQLARLHVKNNQLSGDIHASLSGLYNLKRLDVSNNKFSGELPGLSKISGLKSFFGQMNQFTGRIPEFNFPNLDDFNISFNNISGPIPDTAIRFGISSYMGNSGLCGEPLTNACPSAPPKKQSKIHQGERILMFLGYIILGTILIAVMFLMFCKKTEAKKIEGGKKGAAEVDLKSSSSVSFDYKAAEPSKSEYSIALSAESAMMSTSLIIPMNSEMKDLKFEDLLKAPAELLGRGNFSSMYKVIFEGRGNLAVKRIKDCAVSGEEFRRRMEKIDQVYHPNVLPPLAFYSSKDEKLVVYEYQHNGSLLKLLNGVQSGQSFDWSSRLNVAAGIAQGLAFIHKQLYKEGIAHGNLKCSNVLMDKNMDPCISEYGLMVVDSEPLPSISQGNSSKPMDHDRGRPDYPFKADMYNLGVILLELLTGKLVHNNGVDLTRWVHSVVREEWTAEVFDKVLFAEGACEERMVNLLQVALKCINPSPEARPSINQVANMIGTIKEEEERSIVSEL